MSIAISLQLHFPEGKSWETTKARNDKQAVSGTVEGVGGFSKNI